MNVVWPNTRARAPLNFNTQIDHIGPILEMWLSQCADQLTPTHVAPLVYRLETTVVTRLPLSLTGTNSLSVYSHAPLCSAGMPVYIHLLAHLPVSLLPCNLS